MKFKNLPRSCVHATTELKIETVDEHEQNLKL